MHSYPVFLHYTVVSRIAISVMSEHVLIDLSDYFVSDCLV